MIFLVAKQGSGGVVPGLGVDESGGMHPGTMGMALFSLCLIVGMLLALGGFILWLRHRSRHPLPQPGTLEEFLEEKENEKGRPNRESRSEQDRESWERGGDWWKSDGQER